MAEISLPFGLARNNGLAVTKASEIDIIVDEDTKQLDTIVNNKIDLPENLGTNGQILTIMNSKPTWTYFEGTQSEISISSDKWNAMSEDDLNNILGAYTNVYITE